MRIVVDVMGSDNYPEPDVEGAVLAARSLTDVGIVLVGDETAVLAELSKYDTSDLAIEVVHADQVIAMDDKPSKILREKKASSMHVGLNLVKAGDADAFVTMGNTGAVLAIATLRTLRRIPGVSRPALSLIFPTATRPIMLDAGANADNKPEHLYQFGVMGTLYMERIRKIESPKVGLISNGEEDSKGTSLINEAGILLAESHLNYVGKIEPKEFMQGEVDVGVTDGFTGNMIMKTSEAIASEMSDLIRESLMANPLTILGGLLARSAFTKVRQQLNPDEIGGIPLLGVNGALIVGHGRSNARAVETAVYQAYELVQNKVVAAIAEGLSGNQ